MYLFLIVIYGRTPRISEGFEKDSGLLFSPMADSIHIYHNLNPHKTMPSWEEIFKNQGYFFLDPHPDIAHLAELFKNHSVKRILDLGCGTGRHLVYLSKLGFQMEGFDSSPHAIALAQKWLDEEDITAAIREHAMERSFPYPDMSFDAVISIQVIHHNILKDILFTISEIERVLKPRGLVFVTVPILGSKPVNPKKDWQLHQVENGTYIPQSGPESGIHHHYFTEDELCEAFNKFEPLEIYIDSTDHRCLLAVKRDEPIFTPNRRQGI
jgi:SAM-dependent methyltransferase